MASGESGFEHFFQLPTAKVTSRKVSGHHAWLRYYAGFSQKFVSSIISALQLHSDDLVFDPFAGSGTTNVVCKSVGVPSIGLDLNPVAYVLANAKLAWNVDPIAVRSWIEDLDLQELVRNDQSVYCRSDVFNDRATGLLYRIGLKILSLSGEQRFFLLGSAIEALRKVSVVQHNSNPTWQTWKIKRRSSARIAYENFVAIAKSRLEEFGKLKEHADCSSAILYGDCTNFKPDFEADAIITSPPYLNRLDYVMNYSLENSFLLALGFPEQTSIDKLRKNMLGTVKVTKGAEPRAEWGTICNDVLARVKTHNSRAASTYYYNTLCRYFDGLYKSVHTFYNSLKTGGVCFVVVQTSYFKNIEISLPNILEEMAENERFNEIDFLRAEAVKSHLGRMDPDQRKWVRRKLLIEKVVLLAR